MLEIIKKKHADRVNILKVTNAQLHATIAGLKLAEQDSRNLVHVKNLEIKKLQAERDSLAKEQPNNSAITQHSTNKNIVYSDNVNNNNNRLLGENKKLQGQLAEAISTNKNMQEKITQLKNSINKTNNTNTVIIGACLNNRCLNVSTCG